MKHDEYDYFVQDTYRELTGQSWESAEDDTSGTYFSDGHWVSGSRIAEALKIIADYYSD